MRACHCLPAAPGNPEQLQATLRKPLYAKRRSVLSVCTRDAPVIENLCRAGQPTCLLWSRGKIRCVAAEERDDPHQGGLLRYHWTPETLQRLTEEQDRHQNLVHELEALDTPGPDTNPYHDFHNIIVSLFILNSNMLCLRLHQTVTKFIHKLGETRDTSIKTMQALHPCILITHRCTKHTMVELSQANQFIRYCKQS